MEESGWKRGWLNYRTSVSDDRNRYKGGGGGGDEEERQVDVSWAIV